MKKLNGTSKSIIKEWHCNRIGKFDMSDDDYEKIREDVERQYYTEILEPADGDEYVITPSESGFHKTIKIEGDTFDVGISPSGVMAGIYNFSFIRTKSEFVKRPELIGGDTKKYSQELNDFEYGVTNSHRPLKVLKYMQSILYTFIKRYSPRGIKFMDYDEGRREKVYDYIAKKIAAKSNYFLFEHNNWFFLFKHEDDLLKSKNPRI